MDKVINFDNLIKGERKKYHNPNKKTIQHPARAVVFGPSGSGKTNILLNLLFNPLMKMSYQKVYLYAKVLHEPKYEYLIKKFEKIEQKLSKQAKQPIQILYACDNLDEVIPVEQLDPEIQSVAIFDDYLNERNQDVIRNYFTFGRKFNVSSFYLSQNFFEVDRTIRGQCNYIISFRVQNQTDLKRIFNDAIQGIEWSTVKSVYDEAMRISPHNFIVIDSQTEDEERRVRIGIL